MTDQFPVEIAFKRIFRRRRLKSRNLKLLQGRKSRKEKLFLNDERAKSILGI